MWVNFFLRIQKRKKEQEGVRVREKEREESAATKKKYNTKLKRLRLVQRCRGQEALVVVKGNTLTSMWLMTHCSPNQIERA